MKRYLPLLSFLFLTIFIPEASAQYQKDDSIRIGGAVVAEFTEEYLPYAKIEIMQKDSTVVLTRQTAKKPFNVMSINGNFYFKIPRLDGYIIRFSQYGYKSKCIDLPPFKKRMDGKLLDVIKLEKDRSMLPEVTVKASKIKMVMKGDTIEYNADAFKLSEGSMLDALIRKLPGVELDDNGIITVNGRFVSSLLVNGEEFFRGDPRIALDNLPAYMVNKVKVYEQTNRLIAKRPGEDSPLVVDVNLKRQYSVGWIANAEGAYGTEDRYAGRIFGLRFTKKSRLAFFGNVNNTNDTRQPGISGNWKPAWTTGGQSDTKMGGIEYLLSDQYNKWKLQSNVKVVQEDADNVQEQSSVSFLQGGDVFRRNRNIRNTDNFQVTSGHDIRVDIPGFMLQFQPKVGYAHFEGHHSSYSAMFNAEPYESKRGAALDSLFFYSGTRQLDKLLTNRTSDISLNKGYRWNGNLSGIVGFTVPGTPDLVNIMMNGDFNREKNELFSHYDLRYSDPAQSPDFRNQYQNKPRTSYNMSVEASYIVVNSDFPIYFSPLYIYKQSYLADDRSLYRLEKYTGWDTAEGEALGKLPSTTEALLQAKDLSNSYYSTGRNSTHTFELGISSSAMGFGWSFTPRIHIRTDKLEYERDQLNVNKTRTKVAFEPTVSINFLENLRLQYSYQHTDPSLYSILDIKDDSDPLYITQGNPNLKATDQHSLNLENSWFNRKYQRIASFIVEYNLWKNMLAQSTTYNRSTGVTTTRPENINGNWELRGNVKFSQAVGKNQKGQISTTTTANYLNSVDFISIENSDVTGRSEVRNLNINETFKADYEVGAHSFGLKATAAYQRATSPREDFTTVNSVDFNYGVTAQIALPYRMELSTDFTMYSRRGYGDRSMNTDEPVWNARLSKRFLKGGNLTCIIDGFDILHQLSNIRKTLNVQGRTETWYNTLPSYVMFRLVYRLNIQPKNNAGK